MEPRVLNILAHFDDRGTMTKPLPVGLAKLSMTVLLPVSLAKLSMRQRLAQHPKRCGETQASGPVT